MAVTTTQIGNLHFNYKGAFDNGATYLQDDVVEHRNTDFVAITSVPAAQAPAIPKSVTYTVTVAAGTLYPTGSGNTFHFAGEGVGNPASATTNPALTVIRGETHHFNLDDSSNDGHPLEFATTASSQTSNLYAKNVRYFLDGMWVSQTDWSTLVKFNAAASRRIEIKFAPDAPVGGTPADMWYFCDAHGAGMGNEITVTNATQYWTPIRESFNYRDIHDNTNGTVYYKNDVVKVTVDYDNTLGGSSFSGTGMLMADQVRSTEAMYICTIENTANGTQDTKPWDNNPNWELINSRHDFDDSVIASNKAQGQIATFTGDYLEVLEIANHDKVIGSELLSRSKTGQFPGTYSVNWFGWINGRGGVMVIGSNSTSGNGTNQNHNTATNLAFPFLDWYRSTDHGGTGVHKTPDGQVPKCIQLVQGYNTGMALFNNGEVYHWGYGGHGQNGDASTSTRSYPCRVGGSYQNIYEATNTTNHTWRDLRISHVALSCWDGNDSTHHCGAIDENGDVWMWGYNGYGQLGDGTTTNRNQPTKINRAFFLNEDIVDMWLCGHSYGCSYFLSATNIIYSCGYNGYGQLGRGNTSNQSVPMPCIGPSGSSATTTFADTTTKVVKVQVAGAGSYGRSAVLADDGRLYTCGYNGYGWAMAGGTSQQTSFVQTALGHGSGTGDCDNFWFVGSAQFGSMWTQNTSGVVNTCGRNNSYQLCTGTTTDSTAPVIPEWTIGGQTAAVTNIKKVVNNNMSNSTSYHYVNVGVITNSGSTFVNGRNNRGPLSMGYSDSWAGASTNMPNLVEDKSNGKMQMPRLMNDFQGHIEDIRPIHYASNDSSSHYWYYVWKNDRNRICISGYENGIHGNPSDMRQTIAQPPAIG